MRRDLIIGILVSLAIHVGVAWAGSYKPAAKPKVKEVEPTIQLMEMPKPEEPDEQVVEDKPDTSAPTDIAPPMLTDVPQVVTPDSFVQQVQPPPPEGLKLNNAAIKLPEGRPGGLGKGISIFDPSQLDQQPIAKFQARPQYPFEMRRAGISGQVVVDFIVDSNGEVRNAFAASSSQHEFEAAAVQAVSKWKFRPGRKSGHSVNTHMQVPIVFTLNESE